MESDLDKAFKEAYNKISALKNGVAPDIMLKFYAYNKQANHGNNFTFDTGLNVRNAFKFNAWVQLNGMTTDEAKKEYITLANKILNE